MNCDACREREKQENAPVSRWAFDGMKAAMERTIRRLWILVLVLILLLFGSNAAWIWYEAQWEVTETTEITQEVDGSGSNSIIGGDYYGGQTNGEKDQKPDP